MEDGPSIQFKKPRTADADGVGFNAHGQAEPSVDFDFDEIDRSNPLAAELCGAAAHDREKLRSTFEAGRAVGRDEILKFIFAALLDGSHKPHEVGLKAHLLAWAAGLHPNKPQTQTDLASAAGVSEATISILKKKISKSSNVFAGFVAPT